MRTVKLQVVHRGGCLGQHPEKFVIIVKATINDVWDKRRGVITSGEGRLECCINQKYSSDVAG